MFSVIKTRFSLEWFVRRVQDRISLSSIRRFVVKNSNKSRHSFEYLDREDMLVAHVVGRVDAFIKLPQGWPLLDLLLELISLKSTSQYSKEISLSFLCKIVEVVNSLNPHLRRNISSFVNKILKRYSCNKCALNRAPPCSII